MAVIENKSLSFDNVATDILSYLGNNASVDANKWLDTYSSGAGMTIAEMIAGLATYLSFSAMSSRKEAFLETSKLTSSVYSLANIRGVNIRRPEAPKIVIEFATPTIFPRKIGEVFGKPLWVMGTHLDLYGNPVENTYDCYIGEYEEATVRVASPGDFYTLSLEPTQYEGENKYYISNDLRNISITVRRGDEDYVIKLTTATEDLMRDRETDPEYADAVIKTTIDGAEIIFGYTANKIYDYQTLEDMYNNFDVVYQDNNIIIAGSSTEELGIVYSYDGQTWYKSDITDTKIDNISGDGVSNFMACSNTKGYLYTSNNVKNWIVSSGAVVSDSGYYTYYTFPKSLFTSLPQHVERVYNTETMTSEDVVVDGRRPLALACKCAEKPDSVNGGVIYADLSDGLAVSKAEFYQAKRVSPGSSISENMYAPVDIASNGSVAIAVKQGMGTLEFFELLYSSNGAIWTSIGGEPTMDSDTTTWYYDFKSKIKFVHDRFFLTRGHMGVWEFKPTIRTMQAWRVIEAHEPNPENTTYALVGDTWEPTNKYNYIGQGTIGEIPNTVAVGDAYVVLNSGEISGMTVSAGTVIVCNGVTIADGETNYSWETPPFATDFTFNFCGEKETYEELIAQTTENNVNDVWAVKDARLSPLTPAYPAGIKFRWNGSEWTPIGYSYTFKGIKNSVAELPTTGNTVNDLWQIKEESSFGPKNMLRYWTGSFWSGTSFEFSFDYLGVKASYSDLPIPGAADPQRVYENNKIDAGDIIFRQTFGVAGQPTVAEFTSNRHQFLYQFNYGRDVVLPGEELSWFSEPNIYGVGKVNDVVFDDATQKFIMATDAGIFHKGVADTTWTPARVNGESVIGGSVSCEIMSMTQYPATAQEISNSINECFAFVFPPKDILGGFVIRSQDNQVKDTVDVYYRIDQLSLSIATASEYASPVWPVIAVIEKTGTEDFERVGNSSTYRYTTDNIIKYPKRILGTAKTPIMINSTGEKVCDFTPTELDHSTITVKSTETIILWFAKSRDSDVPGAYSPSLDIWFENLGRGNYVEHTNVARVKVSLCGSGIDDSGNYLSVNESSGIGWIGSVTAVDRELNTNVKLNALPKISITGEVVYNASKDFGKISVFHSGGNVIKSGEYSTNGRILAYGPDIFGIYCLANILSPEEEFASVSQVYDRKYNNILMYGDNTMSFLSTNSVSYSTNEVLNLNSRVKTVGDVEVVGFPLEDLDEISISFLASQGRTGKNEVRVSDIILGSDVDLEIVSGGDEILEFIDGGVEEAISKIKNYVPGYNSSYRRIVSKGDHISHVLAARTDVWDANCYRCVTSCCTSIMPYLRGYEDENGFIIQTYKSYDDNVIFSKYMLNEMNRYRMIGETFAFEPAISTKFIPNLVVSLKQGVAQAGIRDRIRDILISKLYKIEGYFSVGEFADLVSEIDGVIGVHIRKPNDDYKCISNEYLYTDMDAINSGLLFKTSLEEPSYDNDYELGYVDPPIRMKASELQVTIPSGVYQEDTSIEGQNDVEVLYGTEYELSELGVLITYIPSETSYSGNVEHQIFPNLPLPATPIPGIDMRVKFVRFTNNGITKTYLHFYSNDNTPVEIGSYNYSVVFSAVRRDESIITSSPQQLRIRVI